MENQTQIIYSPDYRSPPSGLGTISRDHNVTHVYDSETADDICDPKMELADWIHLLIS